ncbi:hypothetical protein N752_07815 [Desulforamulus aquiferis]|nr:hypothetical protein [Desulforamulus aquiferis]RYD05791.1 hypothetical protein N752_07815 [Desulforamulus aquiferis]
MEYISAHRSVVQQIEREYSAQVTFAWIDVSIYQETEADLLMKTAREMKVQTIPALVLMDNKVHWCRPGMEKWIKTR